MKKYETIETEISGQAATVWLARPDLRNAFNERMVADITAAFLDLSVHQEVRVIVLRGRGKAFCAGADLNWLGAAARYTREQNYDESIRLARCFKAIYTSPKPTVCAVHGASIGGANGLAAACDFAYCTDDAVFSLSEVKIGVVPACISPYVIKRVGECRARDLMLTGRRISGREAQACGLVNASFPDLAALDAHLDGLTAALKSSGPVAIGQCKKLIYDVTNRLDFEEAVEYTANAIADIRVTPEAQEGMAAFLEKRKPKWAE